jgi:hypothetical protein
MNRIHMVPDRDRRLLLLLGSLTAIIVMLLAYGAQAQECYSGSEVDPVTANALQQAAQRFWDLSAQGDVASLKAGAVPTVSANFGSIEQAVVNHKAMLAEAAPSEKRLFVLDASNSQTTWQRADFYCGIYNSPNRVGISIPNLPPGRYALSIASATGKDPITLTMVLQESGKNTWKLAGYYARANTLGGHDGAWYAAKAGEYKSKGQLHNAWFYDLTAWDLQAPVDFVSTPTLDKLSDEIQAAHPADLPSRTSPLLITTGGRTFKVIDMSALPISGDLYVRAQYESANVSNVALASEDNAVLMKALLAKYPEFREAFGGLVARATDAAGRDYVTITPMKEVK